MLVLGITNKLPDGLRLFMWEYDNVGEYEALEEANFLSQVFDIDIYVLKSSEKGYHLVSFDIITLEECEEIQNWSVYRGDYATVKEMTQLDDKGLWNTLRLGRKGKKPKPKFVRVFYCENNVNLKSLGHFIFYQHFCGIPEAPEDRKIFFVKTPVQIAVYNTGIGAKRKPRKDEFET